MGGLATAIRLQASGYAVKVFEANSYPGGKLTQIGNGDYRFDAGPSLFTMPEKVDELLALGNTNTSDFEYERLDEVCRYFYDDNTVIHGWGDEDKFANEIELKLGVKAAVVKKHLAKSAYIFKTTNHLFLEKSLHKVSSYLNWDTVVSFSKLPFLNIGDSMHNVNKKALTNDKLVQLFNRYATYNGSDPYKAPGILNIIPHLEFGRGAFFPKKGMHQITLSLFEKAKMLGVEFYFDEKIKSVEIVNNKAQGITTGTGVKHAANLVVSNVDVVPLYQNLLPNEKQPEKIMKQERSSSALIFYWGIKKSFDQLILHNIFFSEDYKKEFSAIFDDNSIYNDPTVYVNISSKHKHDDAPQGAENWFVMINVPGDKGQNWDEIIAQSKANILKKLSACLGESIEDLIEYEEVLDPRLIQKRTSSHQGSLYGTASNEKMAAFFRHPNFSTSIEDLYFTGGSVHPGGGIPLALSSAKIVSDLVTK